MRIFPKQIGRWKVAFREEFSHTKITWELHIWSNIMIFILHEYVFVDKKNEIFFGSFTCVTYVCVLTQFILYNTIYILPI